jgi:hypothetical protein
MQTARNVAIIVAIAAAIAFLPGGGNAAETALAVLSMAFLATIAWFVYVLSRERQLTLAALSDGQRAILYGALGLIAVLIAWSSDAFDTSRGTLVWIVLLGVAIAAIWRTWLATNSY